MLVTGVPYAKFEKNFANFPAFALDVRVRQSL